MDAIKRELILQRLNVIQYERLPELCNNVGTLTPKREKVIPILESIRYPQAHGHKREAGDGTIANRRRYRSNAEIRARVP